MEAVNKGLTKRKGSMKGKVFLTFILTIFLSILAVKSFSLFIGTILISILFVVGIAVYVGWKLTHPKKRPISESPNQYNLRHKEISFKSKDGKTKLEGWVIEPITKPKMSIVFSHGYKRNRHNGTNKFLPLGKYFVQAGYRVIMFDYRNSGDSEGNTTTVGVNERYDLLGAIDWTKKHYKEPVGIYGVSMGASTALVAAGEDKEVIGVVADSPFSDLRRYLEINLPVWSKLPAMPFTTTILFLLPKILRINIDEVSPIRSLASISPRPVFFVHGKEDRMVPFEESVKMANLDKNSFKIWTPEKIDHGEGFSAYPKEYAERVISFYEHILQNETE